MNHHNFDYDGTVPFYVGDRYYGQDRARDFWASYDKRGIFNLADVGNTGLRTKGDDVTIGSSFTQINIPAQAGILSGTVEVPLSYAALPPTKQSVIIKIAVESPALTNFDLSATAANLNGSTINNLKLSYVENDGASRARIKKAGSYIYEKEPSYEIICDASSAAEGEILIATLVGDGSTFLTIEMSPKFTLFNEQNLVPYALTTATLNNVTITASSILGGDTMDYFNVAVLDSNAGGIRVLNYNGSTIAFTGSTQTVDLTQGNAIAAMTPVRVAHASGGADTLTAYDWSGSSWSQVGSAFSLVATSTGAFAMCALNSTDVAFYDNENDLLKTYRFNGSTWAQVGSSLTIVIGGTSNQFGRFIMERLNSNTIVLGSSEDDQLQIISFNGTTWTIDHTTDIPLNETGVALNNLYSARIQDNYFALSTNGNRMGIFSYQNGRVWRQAHAIELVSLASPVIIMIPFNRDTVFIIDGADTNLIPIRVSRINM